MNFLFKSPEINKSVKAETQSVINTISKNNQSNCKKLVIYESTNAFDILMQDAFI